MFAQKTCSSILRIRKDDFLDEYKRFKSCAIKTLYLTSFMGSALQEISQIYRTLN